MARKFRTVEGVVTDETGKETKFMLSVDGYSQWGGDTALLGDTVDLLADLMDVAREYMPFEDEEVDDAEDHGAGR